MIYINNFVCMQSSKLITELTYSYVCSCEDTLVFLVILTLCNKSLIMPLHMYFALIDSI